MDTLDGSRPAVSPINAADNETPKPRPIGKPYKVSSQPDVPRHCRNTAKKHRLETAIDISVTRRYRPELEFVSSSTRARVEGEACRLITKPLTKPPMMVPRLIGRSLIASPVPESAMVTLK
jgi:hypothetical protein